MITPVSFIDSKLNPISESNKIAVSSFTFTLKHGTTEPVQLVLNTCINKNLADTDKPDFPIYIRANNVYHSQQHHELLREFRTGQPFVMVEPKNLKVFRNYINDCYFYFGTADNFKVSVIEKKEG